MMKNGRDHASAHPPILLRSLRLCVTQSALPIQVESSDHFVMPEPKTKCSECGKAILIATAERTGGLCMPCHRRAHPTPWFPKEVTPEEQERRLLVKSIIEKLIA